ncbi:hypothetical protein S245_036989 [Arachis hypogaea]|nr:uncharacterized protein DS421_11g332890 [Arachis hypogaea]
MGKGAAVPPPQSRRPAAAAAASLLSRSTATLSPPSLLFCLRSPRTRAHHRRASPASPPRSNVESPLFHHRQRASLLSLPQSLLQKKSEPPLPVTLPLAP